MDIRFYAGAAPWKLVQSLYKIYVRLSEEIFTVAHTYIYIY